MIAPGNDGAERYPEIEVFAIAARDCYVTLAISRSAGRLSTKSTYRRPLGLGSSRIGAPMTVACFGTVVVGHCVFVC